MKRSGPSPRFRTYLFDLDGTLIDSIDLIFRCYRHAAETHLSIRPPDSVWRDGLGTPLRDQLGAVSSDPEVIEAMVLTYREHFLEHHDTSIEIYPRVASILDSLSARGAVLGIVTSKLRAGTERGLRLVGLAGRFDAIVTAEDVRRAKPHPEPVESAMAKLDARPESTVFIGDSPHDIAAGRAAGVATGAALWGPFESEVLEDAGPDFLLGSPTDILSI